LWIYSKYYYVGVSSFQILQNRVGISNNGGLVQPFEGRLNNHIFFTGGVKVPLNTYVTLIPSIALKVINPAPASLDINLRAMYQDHFFVGGSMRINDSFTALAGMVINRQIEISYSYDITTSDLRRYNFGSHEIIIGYRIKHRKNVVCPARYWN
jgi:type IX secretion system PorP/SprF family membrane protein